MKWKCRIFDHGRQYMSGFIWRTSKTTYCLCQIRIWAQSSSNPATKSTKNSQTRKLTNTLKNTKPINLHAHTDQNLHHSKTIDNFAIRQIFNKIALNPLNLSIFGLQIVFISSNRLFYNFWSRLMIFKFEFPICRFLLLLFSTLVK